MIRIETTSVIDRRAVRFVLAFLLAVSAGLAVTTHDALAQEQTTTEGEGWITVRPGDTLFSISRRHEVSVSDLRAWNDLTDSGIRAGMRLRIAPPTAPDPVEAIPVDMATDSTAAGSAQPSTDPEQTPAGTVSPLGGGMVAVSLGPGETLYSLANRFGLSPDSLSALNPGFPVTLEAGMLVIVPEDRVTRTRVVRRGDTLFSIARDEGVSVDALRRVNDLSGSTISVGQRLQIPSSRVDSEQDIRLPSAGQFSMQPYPEALSGRTLASGHTLRPDRYLIGHPTLPAGTIVLVVSGDDRHAFAEVIERAPARRPVFIEGSRVLFESLSLSPGDTVSLFRVQ